MSSWVWSFIFIKGALRNKLKGNFYLKEKKFSLKKKKKKKDNWPSILAAKPSGQLIESICESAHPDGPISLSITLIGYDSKIRHRNLKHSFGTISNLSEKGTEGREGKRQLFKFTHPKNETHL